MAKKKHLRRNRSKHYGKSIMLGTLATSLFTSGCLTTDIKPVIQVSTAESGAMEGKAGVSVGGEPSFWGAFGTTLASPFYIYRSKDSKWFPEWREHPWRTAGMTVLYGGIAVAVSSSGGGSDKDTPQPAQNSTATPTQTTTTRPSSSSPSTDTTTTQTTVSDPTTPSAPSSPSEGGSCGSGD